MHFRFLVAIFVEFCWKCMITISLYVISMLVCDLRLKVGKKGAVLGEKIEESLLKISSLNRV